MIKDVPDRVTVAWIETVLESIRQAAGDNEGQHDTEDHLWSTVLKSIAAGTCDDPAACARLAVSSEGIKFDRWFS